MILNEEYYQNIVCDICLGTGLRELDSLIACEGCDGQGAIEK